MIELIGATDSVSNQKTMKGDGDLHHRHLVAKIVANSTQLGYIRTCVSSNGVFAIFARLYLDAERNSNLERNSKCESRVRKLRLSRFLGRLLETFPRKAFYQQLNLGPANLVDYPTRIPWHCPR